jgi:hypothetical protein
MTGKKAANEAKPVAAAANDTDNLKRTLKKIGGSRSEGLEQYSCQPHRGDALAKHSGPETQEKQISAALAALASIGPKDELEGMGATHRRPQCGDSIIDEQPFEGRRENRAQANKLSRTYVTLLEALNRHRGKSQQTVTVEHVHGHLGGQAVMGVVQPPAGGIARNSWINHMPGKFPRALWPPLPRRRAMFTLPKILNVVGRAI